MNVGYVLNQSQGINPAVCVHATNEAFLACSFMPSLLWYGDVPFCLFCVYSCIQLFFPAIVCFSSLWHTFGRMQHPVALNRSADDQCNF